MASNNGRRNYLHSIINSNKMSKDKLIVMLKERLPGHSEIFIAGVAKGYRMALQDIKNVEDKIK